MRLENLSIALYPRRPWAAIDLGFAMARHWWRKLLASWLIVALPVYVIAQALSYNALWVAALVLWWLKPAYEQLPLLFLSRAVFGQALTLKDVAREGRGWIGRQLFANITWRRFSPNRSFNAPVAQLERLRGAERRARLEVLHDGSSARSWLTIVCAHLEVVLNFSLLALVYAMIPGDVSFMDWFSKDRPLIELASNIAYFCALAVIAPFYVAAGFSLYLHRRTELEGWDIELEFRRWSERAAKSTRGPHRAPATTPLGAVILFAAALSLSGGPVEVRAEEASRQDAKTAIDEVLRDPAFGRKESVTGWRFKSDQTDKVKKTDTDNTWAVLLAKIGEALLWIGASGLVVYVIYRLPGWLQWARGSRGARTRAAAPNVLFGLDVSGDDLPDNVAAAALQMIERGDVRGALGLLYRGSLVVLMHRDGVPFQASATEHECVDTLRRRRGDALTEFFTDMTRHWQRMAYGHIVPDDATLRALCRDWSAHFGDAT